MLGTFREDLESGMEGCVLLDVGGVWGMNLEWFEGLDGLVSGGKEGEEEALIFA